MAGNFYGGQFFGGGFFGAGAVVADTGVSPSGGIPATLRARPRSREQLEADRRRFGITPRIAAVIEEVAKRQADSLEADEHKRFEELERQLSFEEIAWQKKYLGYMNEIRQRLIDQEIADRLRAKLEEDDLIAMLVLTAAAV